MEKQIIRWSYWLGLVCVIVSLVWRGLTTVGLLPIALLSVSYMAFYKTAFLLFLTGIATAVRVWSESQKA